MYSSRGGEQKAKFPQKCPQIITAKWDFFSLNPLFFLEFRLINSFFLLHLKVLSRDSVTVTVDAVVYYRVSNPTMATNNVEDFR